MRKVLDGLDVAVDGSRSVITTFEFFEHHFAKVLWGVLLMTQPYPLTGTLTEPKPCLVWWRIAVWWSRPKRCQSRRLSRRTRKVLCKVQ